MAAILSTICILAALVIYWLVREYHKEENQFNQVSETRRTCTTCGGMQALAIKDSINLKAGQWLPTRLKPAAEGCACIKYLY